MPVTTYLNQLPPRHKNITLATLIDQLNDVTGECWTVETHYYQQRRLFRKLEEKQGKTRLYKHIYLTEHQIITCVNTINEAKAYLYGALGQTTPKNKKGK